MTNLLDRAIFGEVFPPDWPECSEPVAPPLPASERAVAHEAPADDAETHDEARVREEQADYLDVEARARIEAAEREAEAFQRMKVRRETMGARR